MSLWLFLDDRPEQGRSMQDIHPIPVTELVRLPGLYRRWELPDVVKMHHAFRIEDAGTHEDGTPLLAIYAAGDGHSEAGVGNAWVGPSGASTCNAGPQSQRP